MQVKLSEDISVEQGPSFSAAAAQEDHLSPEVQDLLGSVIATWGYDVPNLGLQPPRVTQEALPCTIPSAQSSPGSRDTPVRLKVNSGAKSRGMASLRAGDPTPNTPQCSA